MASQCGTGFQPVKIRVPWAGLPRVGLAGFAEHTICRGQQVVRNYKFTGRNGHGQFIARANPGRV